MRVYTIFDDFGDAPVSVLTEAGIDVDVHPHGVQRPDDNAMKHIIENYDGVIIGTSQKIKKDMFEEISCPKIIGTASVGLDHIEIPEDKSNLITVYNTPNANAQSVAEYTIGCALMCCKRLLEGKLLYLEAKDNKKLSKKPEDLFGKTLGVVGAGNISKRIMEFGKVLGMRVICWTYHPERHRDIESMNIEFMSLKELVSISDILSVNLPNNAGTKQIISADLINAMKNDAIFISVSRLATLDYEALLNKARNNPSFYLCLDIDINTDVVSSKPNGSNILVTPHIAGGTIETRKRMFLEIAQNIASGIKKQK